MCVCEHTCTHTLITQSCPTLCDLMNCSLPGSSVHGILQAGILEWVATSFSRGSSQPRNQTPVSCIAGRFFTTEPPGITKNGYDGGFYITVCIVQNFSGGSAVKNPAAMQETRVPISGSGRFPRAKERQPIPVFLPGRSHGQRSLVAYHPCSHSTTTCGFYLGLKKKMWKITIVLE